VTVTTEAAALAGLEYIHSGAAAAPGRTLAVVTLGTWLFDAVSGGYMLRTWIARGGLRRQRASDRLAPRVVFAHFGIASTGLLVWVSYLATRWIVLAWLAVGLLMVVIGLGVSTVTVWTPFPAHRAGPGTGPGGPGDPGDPGGGGPPDDDAFANPAEEALTGGPTDEMLNRALTDDVLLSQLVEDVVARARDAPSEAERRHRAQLAVLIPATHGLAAITTMILAVLTAASTR
jgi:manganese efflux pump family protein